MVAENTTVKGPRILVVDDEPDVRNVLSRFLASEGYSTEGAGDASEALDRFSKERFDLVITDVHMPGEFSGIDLLKIIREGFDTPVIVVSGYGTLDMMLSSIRFGAVDFIAKPLDRERMISIVNRTLGAAEGAATALRPGDLSVEIRFEIESARGSIEPLCEALVGNALMFGMGETRTSSLRLCAKEAAANAVDHGNRKNAAKKVRVLMKNTPREIRVAVADEGEGFDWAMLKKDNPGARNFRMCGLKLIRTLSDELSFNQKGNETSFVFLK